MAALQASSAIPVVDLRGSELAAHGDALLSALRSVGAVQLLLPDAAAALNGRALALFSAFLRRPEAYKARFAIADGATTDGYHAMGALAPYYNANRSGVIFEDDALADLFDGGDEDFVAVASAWRAACRRIAAEALEAVAAAAGADAAPFAAGGAFDARRGGQFHAKRTHASGAAAGDVLLPPHRDPSLLSMVNHGASPCGLEVYVAGAYSPLPLAGPAVVTLLAGSLLSAVLPGVLAPKHRVVAGFDDADDAPRVAATFFFQPRDDARVGDLAAPNPRAHPTYAEWKARAYRRYFKATRSRVARAAEIPAA